MEVLIVRHGQSMGQEDAYEPRAKALIDAMQKRPFDEAQYKEFVSAYGADEQALLQEDMRELGQPHELQSKIRIGEIAKRLKEKYALEQRRVKSDLAMPLSPLGRQQARDMAEELVKFLQRKISKRPVKLTLYVSPMVHAGETADAIEEAIKNKGLKLEITREEKPLLADIVHGDFWQRTDKQRESLPGYAQYIAALKKGNKDTRLRRWFDTRPPNVESPKLMAEGVKQFVDENLKPAVLRRDRFYETREQQQEQQLNPMSITPDDAEDIRVIVAHSFIGAELTWRLLKEKHRNLSDDDIAHVKWLRKERPDNCSVRRLKGRDWQSLEDKGYLFKKRFKGSHAGALLAERTDHETGRNDGPG